MEEKYYAEIDDIGNNYIRLLKIIDVDHLNKTSYFYDVNSSKWIQCDYIKEFKFDKMIYDEVSKKIALELIERWEKNSNF